MGPARRPLGPLSAGAAVLTVVLVLAQFAEANRQSRQTQLAVCRKALSNMTEGQINAVRDAVQIYGQYRRKYRNWALYMEYFNDGEQIAKTREPDAVASFHLAYKTNLTRETIEERMDAEENAMNTASNRIKAQIEQLKAMGAVPPGVSEMDVQKCSYGRTNPHLYEYRPKVSFMLQYFKRPHIIQPFIQRLIDSCQAVAPLELVVNVDHPADHEAWANLSYSTNGLVVPVFSSNVHEIRAYNRLAHMARGEYLIMLADDDYVPTDCTWLANVIRIFDKWPDAGVIGIRNYVRCFTHTNNIGHNWFRDPALDLPMQFVQRVDMAPMALRKAAYMHVGGMDETLSEPGECGIISDWEICHRMWLSGWQVVATTQVQMQHDKKQKEGGTHTPENLERCWGKQQAITGFVMESRGDPDLEVQMCEAARQLNLRELQLVDPSQCPYVKEGCTP